MSARLLDAAGPAGGQRPSECGARWSGPHGGRRSGARPECARNPTLDSPSPSARQARGFRSGHVAVRAYSGGPFPGDQPTMPPKYGVRCRERRDLAQGRTADSACPHGESTTLLVRGADDAHKLLPEDPVFFDQVRERFALVMVQPASQRHQDHLRRREIDHEPAPTSWPAESCRPTRGTQRGRAPGRATADRGSSAPRPDAPATHRSHSATRVGLESTRPPSTRPSPPRSRRTLRLMLREEGRGFFRMSRSVRDSRFSLRNCASSSRSAVVRPSAPGCARPGRDAHEIALVRAGPPARVGPTRATQSRSDGDRGRRPRRSCPRRGPTCRLRSWQRNQTRVLTSHSPNKPPVP